MNIRKASSSSYRGSEDHLVFVMDRTGWRVIQHKECEEEDRLMSGDLKSLATFAASKKLAIAKKPR